MLRLADESLKVMMSRSEIELGVSDDQGLESRNENLRHSRTCTGRLAGKKKTD